MIFEFAEISCTLEVLRILNKKESRYSILFKTTKVSHTTLQRVLKELANKRFIIRDDIGHQKVNYKITEKGRDLFKVLLNLNETVNI